MQFVRLKKIRFSKKMLAIGHNETDEMDFWTIDEYKKFADAMMDDPLYLALTYDDFDLEARTVSINKSFQVVCGEELIGPPKTPRGIRKISVSEHLCNEVRDFYNMCYDKNSDRLFPVYKNDLYRHISAFFCPA